MSALIRSAQSSPWPSFPAQSLVLPELLSGTDKYLKVLFLRL